MFHQSLKDEDGNGSRPDLRGVHFVQVYVFFFVVGECLCKRGKVGKQKRERMNETKYVRVAQRIYRFVQTWIYPEKENMISAEYDMYVYLSY